MRGTILGVHGGRGIVIGPNQERLEFPLSEWRSPGTPAPGQIVDFVEANGEAQGVFAVPGALAGNGSPTSNATIMGAIGCVCLVLSFVIPFIPTIAAFVLGVIGAGQAKAAGNDDTGLVLSRISWIGALVLLVIGVLTILAIFALIGTLGFSAIWHEFGNEFYH
jgi:hypothetical protein